MDEAPEIHLCHHIGCYPLIQRRLAPVGTHPSDLIVAAIAPLDGALEGFVVFDGNPHRGSPVEVQLQDVMSQAVFVPNPIRNGFIGFHDP